jgi:hypothetical protein
VTPGFEVTPEAIARAIDQVNKTTRTFGKMEKQWGYRLFPPNGTQRQSHISHAKAPLAALRVSEEGVVRTAARSLSDGASRLGIMPN